MEILVQLFWHFVEYFHSWRGSVALGIAALLVYFRLRLLQHLRSASSGESALPPTSNHPGLRRYAYNLDDLESGPERQGHEDDRKAHIIHPLKSSQGIAVPKAYIPQLHYKYDHLFSFAELKPQPSSSSAEEPQWRLLSQREYPNLALLDIELWIPGPKAESHDMHQVDRVRDVRANGGYLLLRFPLPEQSEHTISLHLPLYPTPERARMKKYQRRRRLLDDDSSVLDVTSEISKLEIIQLRRFLGVENPLALFRVVETRQQEDFVRGPVRGFF